MSAVTGYNLFLIIVTVVAAVLIAAVTMYLLVAFSHPEDRNQAWWPKIVVCFSMFIAISTVLLFPLDVANRRACDPQILYSDCELTLPMRSIWYGIYIVNVVLVYLITPFTLFYYEADSDLSLYLRLKSSVIWTVASVFVFGAILGIMYAVGGKVAYDTTLLSSGLASMGEFQAAAEAGCIALAGDPANGCDALAGDVREQVFKVRPSFQIFIIAVASILGWLLLMVMGGVGLIALPLDMILAWFSRPQKTITKTQYIEKAKAIGERAKELAGAALDIKKKEETDGKSRKLRTQAKALGKELLILEDDERELEKLYPQGEDRDSSWVLYVLSFWFSLIIGVLFAIVAISWIVHVVVYILVSPPLHPMLNSMFEALDDVFPLFGVIAFSIWCFFLILAAIKGFTKLGLNFVLIQLYPMKLGATMMSSFLVNSALILLSSTAVVQFCTQAFEGYAQQTAIQEVFGNDIFYLESARPIFQNNVFIYILLAFSALTALYLMIRGPGNRRHKKLTLEEIYAMG